MVTRDSLREMYHVFIKDSGIKPNTLYLSFEDKMNLKKDSKFIPFLNKNLEFEIFMGCKIIDAEFTQFTINIK